MNAKAKPLRLKLGSAVARRGELVRGALELAQYPDAAIVSPVMIAAGALDGPVLWVQGCVHGTEVGGSVALARFLRGLPLKEMRGTIVAVLLANPSAFRAFDRNTPLDGENLNRVFPGAAAAGHTAQMADCLMQRALAMADAVIDLHSGGDRSIVPFYALYRDDGSKASRAAARLAHSAATPDVWGSKDAWLGGAMISQLTARGIPGLIIECGGGAQVPQAHLDHFEAALRGVSQALGIVPGAPPVQPAYRHMDTAELVHSTQGGLFVPEVQAGECVSAGQVLGRILNLYGDVVETITSPIGSGWIGAIRRRYMPVYSGDMIAEVMNIVTDR